ncbi:MAG: RND transporter, partial [Alphaproteobacteria bacterium]|nr:RND transporter [Alphaproteobacteria bacterium]
MMIFQRLLVGLVESCRRNALLVVLASAIAAIFAGSFAASHLRINTDTDEMFSPGLPWRQRAQAFKSLFPQFQDLLVVVIDAREPEQAEDTAAALAESLATDHEHFLSVRRPDASPFLRKEGLLLLDSQQLESLTERMIDAQPFLGELAKDPSARGLFDALSLLATGVEQGQVNLAPYQTALRGFHEAMANVLAGHPHPLSWERLLGGELADLAG